MWAEAPVSQPSWDDFRRARILLTTTELINHKMFFDRACNDLTPYTSCFAPFGLDVCYDKTGLQCSVSERYRRLGGTCNNLLNTNQKLGAQFSAYSRLIAPEYHDCEFHIAFVLILWLKITSFQQAFIQSGELPSIALNYHHLELLEIF